jgi:hypothetical protein
MIASKEVNSKITAICISSIIKFVQYNFLNLHTKNIQKSVHSIVNVLINCKYESVSIEEDESTLLAILELLRIVIVNPIGSLLFIRQGH